MVRSFNGHAGFHYLQTVLAFVNDNSIYGKVQPGNVNCAEATAKTLDDIISHFQQVLPNKRIIFRADVEFQVTYLLLQCDDRGVDFVVGFTSNAILMRKIKSQITRVKKFHLASGQSERVFTEFMWTPGYGSWQGRSFRVIAKVE